MPARCPAHPAASRAQNRAARRTPGVVPDPLARRRQCRNSAPIVSSPPAISIWGKTIADGQGIDELRQWLQQTAQPFVQHLAAAPGRPRTDCAARENRSGTSFLATCLTLAAPAASNPTAVRSFPGTCSRLDLTNVGQAVQQPTLCLTASCSVGCKCCRAQPPQTRNARSAVRSARQPARPRRCGPRRNDSAGSVDAADFFAGQTPSTNTALPSVAPHP